MLMLHFLGLEAVVLESRLKENLPGIQGFVLHVSRGPLMFCFCSEFTWSELSSVLPLASCSLSSPQ